MLKAKNGQATIVGHGLLFLVSHAVSIGRANFRHLFSQFGQSAYLQLTVAHPLAGMANCSFLPPTLTIEVLATPALYMTVMMLPSGFMNASASPPVVSIRLAPGATNCERWRKT